MNLLDHLQDQGYEPQDGTGRTLVADLAVSGVGTVRATISPDDDSHIYAFDASMTLVWSARFTLSTPDTVIVAALEAAEWELADRRGGPVTPAQTRTA